VCGTLLKCKDGLKEVHGGWLVITDVIRDLIRQRDRPGDRR
jgi:hypothetical protein